ASGVGIVLRQNVQELARVASGDNPCWVVLSQVRAPGNFGTLVRTSAAIGALVSSCSETASTRSSRWLFAPVWARTSDKPLHVPAWKSCADGAISINCWWLAHHLTVLCRMIRWATPGRRC